eukprot:COSAG05_NODE_125_length_17331_cov_16.188058_20_plen_102_part_00
MRADNRSGKKKLKCAYSTSMYVSAGSSAAHGSCLSDLRKQYVYRGTAVLCALHDPVQIYHFHISSTPCVNGGNYIGTSEDALGEFMVDLAKMRRPAVQVSA